MGGSTSKDLFLELLELSPEHRLAKLERVRSDDPELAADVESLLHAHQGSSGLLCHPTYAWSNHEPPSLARQATGQVLGGRYRIEALLGEGAFGEVYLARQLQPLQRTVAIKLLKPGMDSRQVLARFELERRALAMMDHPNIARVFDAGATEAGRPYVVMELIQGEPITTYAEKLQLGIRERLALMASVAGAVLHAHQKGIIHRDLKPTNILVTATDRGAAPKIIDFGIAKATEPDPSAQASVTSPSQLMGTPLYMSPEQADPTGGVEVDTRSDIFALGAVLYELLTGSPPLSDDAVRGKSYAEVRGFIRTFDPPPPSVRATVLGHPWARSLRGELDWIVMKCLEKEPDRRYGSAALLAADIGAYIDGGIVLAAPPSRTYRARKFVNRHRGPVAATVGLITTLAFGVIGTTWGLIGSIRAEDAATRQTTRATVARSFLEETLRGASPLVARGRDTQLLDAMMDDAVRRLDAGELSVDPEADAQMRVIIAGVYEDLAQFAIAARVLSPVSDGANVSAVTKGRAALISSRIAMADDELELADRKLSEANEAFSDSGVPDPADQSALYAARGVLAARRSQLDEAIEYHRRAVEAAEHAAPASSELVATRSVAYAAALADRGRLAESRSEFERALDLLSSTPTSPVHVAAWSGLSELLVTLGEADSAVETMRRALEDARVIYPDPHPSLAAALHNLAGSKFAAGDPEGAIGLLEESLRMLRAIHGDRSRPVADELAAIGASHSAVGRLDAGARSLSEAIAIYEALMPDGSREAVNEYLNLAATLRRAGRTDEAVEYAERATSVCEKVLPPDSPDIYRSLGVLGTCLRDAGRLGEAIDAYRRTLNMRDPARDADYPWLTDHRAMLGTMLLEVGDAGSFREAEEHLAACLGSRQGVLHESDPRLATTRLSLGRAIFENTRSAPSGPESLARLTRAEELLTSGIETLLPDAERMPPAHRSGRLRPAIQALLNLYDHWESQDHATGQAPQRDAWRARASEFDARFGSELPP